MDKKINSLAIVAKITIDDNHIDKKLFEKFLEILPSTDGSINFITQCGVEQAFKPSSLDNFQKYFDEWDNAEHEFLDPELEKKQKYLRSLIGEYLRTMSVEACFPVHPKSERCQIPKEWRETQPDRFNNVVKKLNSLTNDIFDTHQELIRIGRKKLYVSHLDIILDTITT